jgi:hypothetical protein
LPHSVLCRMHDFRMFEQFTSQITEKIITFSYCKQKIKIYFYCSRLTRKDDDIIIPIRSLLNARVVDVLAYVHECIALEKDLCSLRTEGCPCCLQL